MTGGTPAPALPLAADLMARWGIAHDAARGVLSLAPQLIPGERRSRCPAFRAGRTVVALELRVRPSSATLHVWVKFGPPLRVEVALPSDMAWREVMVDDVPVAGPRVAFEARAEHQVTWLG